MGSKEVAVTLLLSVAAYKQLRGYFADTVDDLVEGSVVYQDLDARLFGDLFEHSGIYVGGYEVVSLASSGEIVAQSTREFLEGGSNRFIWASCRGPATVGGRKVANRARAKVGRKRDYNIAFDNCHQFTSGCLTGHFENADNFLWMLKDTAKDELRADNWRVWDRDGAIRRACDQAIREISQDRRLLQKVIAADFKERRKLLGDSFDRLETSCAIKDANGFLDGLAAIAKAYGGDLPWADFDSFDDWMRDGDTVLKL